MWPSGAQTAQGGKDSLAATNLELSVIQEENIGQL